MHGGSVAWCGGGRRMPTLCDMTELDPFWFPTSVENKIGVFNETKLL